MNFKTMEMYEESHHFEREIPVFEKDMSGNYVLDASGLRNQVDVRIEIEPRPYGVDYTSLMVLNMKALDELILQLTELESREVREG